MPRPARTTPTYRIEVPSFSGPLDLLLHLIEREELDITVISLARVTEQYLLQVEQLKQDRVEHMIDFLVIGARLVLIKSRALLPQQPAPSPDEAEEDPAEALIRQLRLYRQYKEAASALQAREIAGLRTHLRVAPPPRLEGKLDLTGVTTATLLQAFYDVLKRAETTEESTKVVQQPQVTIEGQLQKVRRTLGERDAVGFHELLSPEVDRVEVAITLLATLELVKRHEVTVHQSHLFGPIQIRAYQIQPDARTQSGEAPRHRALPQTYQ